MSEPTVPPTTPPTTPPSKPLPKANSYAWRLLMLVPAVALASYGYWRYADVPSRGTIEAIRASSKGGISGEVQDAYAGISLTTADLYLVVARRNGEPVKLKPFENTPLGNGLTWPLDAPMELADITRVEVWNHNAIFKDKAIDRVELPGDRWSMDGQTFHIALVGTHEQPPKWPLPLAAVGATLGAVVVLKFVWDQAL